VRLKELCSQSGCSAATVKYYLREGLLHQGAAVNAREADYDDSHIERLRLIRALREVGDLSITSVRDVVVAIETPRNSIHDVLGSAVHALGPLTITTDHELTTERQEVLEYLDEIDWLVADDAPAIDLLASVVARIREFWGDIDIHVLDRYRIAIDELAARDLDVIGDIDDIESAMRKMVVGTVLWDAAMIALRRLAAENHSRRRYSNRPEDVRAR
jgi:DNA-binding transcriptional MerR regulator